MPNKPRVIKHIPGKVPVRIFLDRAREKEIKRYAKRHDVCFTNALEKLVRAGAEVLMGRKEEADGTDRR